MKIQTTASNIELTSDIHSYLDKRLGQITKLLKNSDASLADVKLGKDTNHHQKGEIYTTEINLSSDGENFFARTEQESLFAAIDIAKDELVRVLKNKKEKKDTVWKKGGQSIKKIIKGLSF